MSADLEREPATVVDAGELHPNIHVRDYPTLHAAIEASELADAADFEAHEADRQAEWAADAREIAAMQERMTPEQARAVVERANSDDEPERDADADRYEYSAARRVLAEERGWTGPDVQARSGDVIDMPQVQAEADRDRAERADPATARMVDARDEHAAGGRFDLADATQRIIESIRAGRGEENPRHIRCRGSEPTDRELRAGRDRGAER